MLRHPSKESRMMPRPSLWFGLVVSCALIPATTAARQTPVETIVPITVVTAADIAHLPSCSRIVTGDFTVAPTPALRLSRTKITLPAPTTPTDNPTSRVQVRHGDGTPQSLDQLVCFESLDDYKNPLLFLYDSRVMGELAVGLPPGPALRVPEPPATGGLFLSPVLQPAEVQVTRGAFAGPTTVEVNGTPAQVLSQTALAAYWSMPPNIAPGTAEIIVENSGRRVRFTPHLLALNMSADDLDLLRGQSTTLRAEVTGPDRLLPGSWVAGDVSEVNNMATLRQLFPDAKVPRPGEPAVVLFRLENTSRDTVSMSPAKNDVFIDELNRGDFSKGPYTYTGKIQSKRAGGFNVNGVVVAFFAPLPGTVLPPK
jgi:hypothetical protein